MFRKACFEIDQSRPVEQSVATESGWNRSNNRLQLIENRSGPVLIGFGPVFWFLENSRTGCGCSCPILGPKTGPDRTLKHYSIDWTKKRLGMVVVVWWRTVTNEKISKLIQVRNHVTLLNIFFTLRNSNHLIVWLSSYPLHSSQHLQP